MIFTFGEDYSRNVVVSDSNAYEIEQLLGRIVFKARTLIAKKIEEAREWQVERSRQDAEDREQRRLAAEVEQRRQEEERIEQLTSEIQCWRLAAGIRLYLSEVGQTVMNAGMKATIGGPADRWLAWIESYADQIDPIARLNCDLTAERKARGI